MRKLNKFETLELFEKDLNKLSIRKFIKSVYPKYDQYEVYVIYDGINIETYNKEIHDIKKSMKQFKSYLISYPFIIK